MSEDNKGKKEFWEDGAGIESEPLVEALKDKSTWTGFAIGIVIVFIPIILLVIFI